MAFSIVPFEADSPMRPSGPLADRNCIYGAAGWRHSVMPPWPSLASQAFFLKSDTRPAETIFYYDSLPAGNQNAASPPVFVLIHGLGDEADSWRHLIPLLSSGVNAGVCRVLALDLPGFGRSSAPGKISIKTHTAAVLTLLEAAGLGPETPVFLVGNSMGAGIAEAAALKKPELVRGLILIDGSIPGGPSNPGLYALAKLLFSRKWYRSYRGNHEGAWASLYPYYADLDAMPPEDKEFLRRRVMARVESPTQERAFFATQRSLVWIFISASSWFARGIRGYGGKILLLWGERDKIIPLSTAEAFRNLHGDTELKVIPGAGHLPQQERPRETAKLIMDFVQGKR